MTAEVVTMRDYTLRDIPAVLRKIADQVESGEFGTCTSCVVVVSGDDLDVCLAGDTHSPADAHMLLHAGMLRLVDAVHP